ncbi:hypothetical protein RJ639_027333 [Escallonia herrerae]|uniref:Uncharacterized protein n=1 Tax=Escallonia herrerae TaxID=1293975 RepID=A0AA89BKJ4_9ASTE|nr:hypothetical protein RJ639_027333 [Escallonia herrerae]
MCNYCNKKVTGSYSKVKGHLLAIPLCGVTACKNLSAEIMKAIKKEHDDAERRKNIRTLEARKQADYLTLPDGSDLLQNKKTQGKLASSYVKDHAGGTTKKVFITSKVAKIALKEKGWVWLM